MDCHNVDGQFSKETEFIISRPEPKSFLNEIPSLTSRRTWHIVFTKSTRLTRQKLVCDKNLSGYHATVHK